MKSRMIGKASLAVITTAMFSFTLCSANETFPARTNESRGAASARVLADKTFQDVPERSFSPRTTFRLLLGGLATIGAWIGTMYKRMDDRRIVRQMSQSIPDNDAERDLQQEIARRFNA